VSTTEPTAVTHRIVMLTHERLPHLATLLGNRCNELGREDCDVRHAALELKALRAAGAFGWADLFVTYVETPIDVQGHLQDLASEVNAIRWNADPANAGQVTLRGSSWGSRPLGAQGNANVRMLVVARWHDPRPSASPHLGARAQAEALQLAAGGDWLRVLSSTWRPGDSAGQAKVVEEIVNHEFFPRRGEKWQRFVAPMVARTVVPPPTQVLKSFI